jgi:hypothetical protein
LFARALHDCSMPKYRSVLDELQADLEATELELNETIDRANRLSDRMATLAQAMKALTDLVGFEKMPDSPDQLVLGGVDPENRRGRSLTAHVVDSVSATDSPTIETGRTPESARVVPGPTATVDRVVAVIRASSRSLTRAQVEKGMRDRGWVEPDWKVPSAAVMAALKRARDRGQLLNENGSWTLRTQADSPGATGQLETRRPPATFQVESSMTI